MVPRLKGNDNDNDNDKGTFIAPYLLRAHRRITYLQILINRRITKAHYILTYTYKVLR